ncbi:MAG TPA: chemotaxis protein CheW [Anaeromyxobacter sp.]
MTAETTEILVFQVGASAFAAVVHDAVRIGSVRDVPAEELVVGSALGMPFERTRGIVVAAGEAQERTLVVDQVLGVRSLPAEDVHPLPPLAAACLSSGAVTGFVVMDGAPTLLIDLRALVREHPAAPHKRAA